MLDSRCAKLNFKKENIKSNYTILESHIYKFRIGFYTLKFQILQFGKNNSNLFGKDLKLKLVQILLALFHLIGSSSSRYLTNVYGPQSPIDKLHFLNSLKIPHPIIKNSKWIIGGDVKIITSLVEK